MKSELQKVRTAFAVFTLLASVAMAGSHAMAEGPGYFQASGVTTTQGVSNGKVSISESAHVGYLHPEVVSVDHTRSPGNPFPGVGRRPLRPSNYTITRDGTLGFEIAFNPPLKEGTIVYIYGKVYIEGNAENEGEAIYPRIRGIGWQ